MTCETGVCGTGGYTGPQPGDPDASNVAISAAPAFGGIDVTWTYPAVNPHAVAHSQLFRATSADFTMAMQIATVAGSFYYDKLDTGTTYYYWIRIVSINGTVGEPIGPASATAKPLIQDLIEQLTGQIDQGVLAGSLKSTLDQISMVNANLNQEIFDRENGDTSFAQALLDVQNGVAEAHTYIANEISTRADADGVIAEQLQLTAAAQDDQIAAVTIRADAWIGPHNTLSGTVSNIGALWTAQVTVNDLIGGFGVYNDGSTVEAGFDVDTFWIGRTQANKRKPFIVSGGVVYIDEAAIEKLTFTKLRDAAGTFIVQDGQVKASYIDTKGLAIKDNAGNVIFSSGVPLSTSRISGLGTLATANSVTIGGAGSQVKFSDGTTVATADFVNKLSKIGSGNISTFMEAAAIGSAYIGNAEIKNANIDNLAVTGAKIANLAVDTLQIAGNAVTTPLSAYTAGGVSFTGETTLQTLPTFASRGGPVLILFGGNFATGAGTPDTLIFRVYRNSTLIFSLSLQPNGDGPISLPPLCDTPGNGVSVAYSISCSASAATWTATHRGAYSVETTK